ncbi:NADH--cytochrome b5 reductase 1-like [Gossypium australe]|uniref:NADH--cytochrome b5 reductase 1-like n=1 Tax=Gossypium australe TaxID=47621 RepID=A0A5B6VJR0_9ROSI|nr:NADH--cytochrome b5 reductase 1-like [Gossypium australe]
MGSLMMLFVFAPGSITTWDELAGKFLQKFFLISKAVQLGREIVVIRQMEGESFHEACERSKTLSKNAHTTDFLSGCDYKCFTISWRQMENPD